MGFLLRCLLLSLLAVGGHQAHAFIIGPAGEEGDETIPVTANKTDDWESEPFGSGDSPLKINETEVEKSTPKPQVRAHRQKGLPICPSKLPLCKVTQPPSTTKSTTKLPVCSLKQPTTTKPPNCPTSKPTCKPTTPQQPSCPPSKPTCKPTTPQRPTCPPTVTCKPGVSQPPKCPSTCAPKQPPATQPPLCPLDMPGCLLQLPQLPQLPQIPQIPQLPNLPQQSSCPPDQPFCQPKRHHSYTPKRPYSNLPKRSQHYVYPQKWRPQHGYPSRRSQQHGYPPNRFYWSKFHSYPSKRTQHHGYLPQQPQSKSY